MIRVQANEEVSGFLWFFRFVERESCISRHRANVGEWMRLRVHVSNWKSIGPGSVVVVQEIGYEGDGWNGTTYGGFCREQERWLGPTFHLERADMLVVGQKVGVKLYEAVKIWVVRLHPWKCGSIYAIDANGNLRIYTPASSKAWMLDPSRVELVEE
ncbi:E3 ubiquitin-protein ligase KEG-like [Carya illinoinensis]|uniref:E3 ubiquitin-protein ligase KEG-like n=1 Tax=Carya illinoinensis TaxID=32201 RepID=UPI001C72102E|nr:E3 ubiquitin-protein ligase KEG-like [Carya illinoinensis]